MDKLKKLLIAPVVYHVIVFIAMFFLADTNYGMGIVLADVCGVLIAPMFMAIVSMIHAVIHDGKVYDYIYNCLIYLLLIGVIRIGVYFVLGEVIAVMFAAACIFVAIGVFAIWACLFAFTDRFMKKSPNKKNKKK